MPTAIARSAAVPNPLAASRGASLPPLTPGRAPSQRAGRGPLSPRSRRAAALAGALGGGAMAVSLAISVTAVLLIAFSALILSLVEGVTGASMQDASAGPSTVVAVGRLLTDALGSTAPVLVLLGAMLLLGAAGACLSAWLLRGLGAGRAWAITGVGWLISVAAVALLATSATSLLSAPVASLLPLLPTDGAGGGKAMLLTMVGFVMAIRVAVVIGLSSCSWMLAAQILRPRALPASDP